jgi:hypothetical protein
MATLWIKEHTRKPQMGGGPDIWAEPAAVEQAVTISGTSAQSAAFAAQTKFITITSDSAFCYLVASNPTAATTNFRVEAGQILTFGVVPPSGTGPYKIAGIQTT